MYFIYFRYIFNEKFIYFMFFYYDIRDIAEWHNVERNDNFLPEIKYEYEVGQNDNKWVITAYINVCIGLHVA